MNPESVIPFSLKTALRTARSSLKSGSSTVWDLLLLQTGLGTEALKETLEREGGVLVALDAERIVQRPGPSDAALKALGAIAVAIHGASKNGVVIATADPWDPSLREKIERLLGTTVSFVCMPNALLLPLLQSDQAAKQVQPEGVGAPQASDTVIGFVNAALRAAFEGGASDVHFEYSRAGLVVKLRQDGILVHHSTLAGTDRADEVISRIKVLAQLDITERRVPQDGRFRFEFQSRSIDLRVSIMPSVHGEDAVLRLLDKAQLRGDSPVSLTLLGFDDESAASLGALAELPHGMMLVTGPTGSGKTTTVYAILSEVNNGQEKIITIEDPVEYELEGVLQIPVNERKNLTFARGLRSILRHDPDRILVGEIRDAETAEIAVQSALTGHQVFTTVHANSVLDVTGRFRHFGLDMFGFMSALNGVIVQRLVRKMCSYCAGSRAPSPIEARWLSTMGFPIAAIPQPIGCDHCRGTGYKGRLVIAEVHSIDDAFRDLVTGNAPVSRLREHIANTNVQSLGAQAARLVAHGKTSTEEVKRVVGWQ